MALDPAVSLILPTYNRAELLPAAIQSVLDQSFGGFELIVVDDGSTDGTEGVLEGFDDPRIRRIRLTERGGAAGARNAGIAAAGAEWVGFMDSDVLWAPEKLERQFEALKGATDRVGAQFCAFWLQEHGRIRRVPEAGLSSPSEGWYQQLLWGNFIDTPSLLIRKPLLLSLGGFDAAMPRFQDWDLALRLSRETEIQFLDEPLYLSSRHGDSISSNAPAAVEALHRLQGKHHQAFSKDSRLWAQFLAFTARFECLSGRPDRARILLRQAIRDNPWGAKLFAGYLLSFLSAPSYQGLVRAWEAWRERRAGPAPELPGWLHLPPAGGPHG
jgi:glycosyltransferase involved in cell wall biosynthesis